MTDGTLLRAVRHNCWANEQVIDFCSRLTPDQLAWTVPGTYGGIHATLHHIVGSEHLYVFLLTGGKRSSQETGGGPEMTPDGLAPLDELRQRARSSQERMEEILAGNFDPNRVLPRRRGGTVTAGVLVSHFVHHGSDHRAHIGTILGANGVQPPILDVWAYGRSIGEVEDAPATS